MIHARKDYDRIQDPLGLIAEDEPVFLLRAKDKFAPSTLKFWASQVASEGDQQLADHIISHADKMVDWQKNNTSKVPDTPEDEFRK